MANQMKHGVMVPGRRARAVPARAINVRSRKKNSTTRIRLDKLLRAARPRVCIKRRLGGIGDVLMTTPITKALKMLIPRCHLVYATDLQYAQGALGQVIEHNPYVDELTNAAHIVDGEYDYIVDITTTGLDREKSGAIPPNRIDMFAEAVGVDVASDPLPVYIIKEEEREWANKEIEQLIGPRTDDTKIIAIQARSNDARRTWPLESVEELAHILAQNDMHVFLFDWGHTVERWKEVNPNLHYILDTELPQVAALIEQCDVVVCPDSAILHLAGALQKKIVTVFGPVPPESRINYYANATAVTKNLPCSPCWYNPRCIKSEGNKLSCLTTVSPKEVSDMVIQKLSEKHRIATSITYGADVTNKNQDKVILITRGTDGLGDLLMTTPAIDAIAAEHPGMKIEVACQSKLWPVLQNNPNVSSLRDISEGINTRRYYMVIDISTPCARYEATRIGSGRPVQKSRVEIFAEACNVRNTITSLKPRYYVSEVERLWAKQFIEKVLPEKNGKPIVAVGLRSAELYRNWPEKNYSELFKLLNPHLNIILLDHSRDHTYTEIIDACGFSLRKAIAILEQCDGIITVDTSLLHFAAALEIPTVALFGPIDYKARCKGYDKVTVVKCDIDCSPCWRNCLMPCKKTGLIKGDSECMSLIPPSHVAAIAKKKFQPKEIK